MQRRWKISIDGGANYLQEVVPANTQSVKYSWTRDLKAGQVFFRKKLTAPLRFTRKEDFDFFRAWERTAVRRCNTIYICQDRLCSGQWKRFWKGRFSVGAGKFDLDACEFSVKPEVFDKYSCILDHINDKVNLMDVAPSNVEAVTFPANIEFRVCLFPAGIGSCSDVDPMFGWDFIMNITEPCDSASDLWLYWREKIVTNCVDGSPVPPPGTGWILITNDCVSNGTATYARIPTVAWTFDPPESTYSTTQDPVEPATSCSSWVYMGTSPAYFCFAAAGDVYAHVWMCPQTGTPVDYRRSRLLHTCMKYMLERSGCDIELLTSDFFEWDPIGDAPGYVPGENYITGEPNQMDQIFLLQKRDAISPGATNPSTKGEMTLGEMFQWFRALQVYWDIDEVGRLRLEHWHFWTYSQGLDLTVGDDFELNRGMNRYEHLSQEIPSRERCSMAEANGPDFVGLDIIYDSPCVQSDDRDSVEETRLGFITTDISFIEQEPTAIASSGFVMLATRLDGIVYNVIIDFGAITGTPTTNAPLSWANIQAAFWTWNRYLKRGNMNGVDVTFDGIQPNIQQPDLKARFCCGMESWDPRETVKTELGQRFLNNRNAFVEKAELEDFDDRLSITPRYEY